MRGQTAETIVERQREFAFSDKNFQHIRGLVREHTGINLTEAKRDLVYSRLSRRLRRLGIEDFDTYCRILEKGPNGELTEFINAITTNLTFFFREGHHFEYLARTVLPELLQKKRPGRRIRIWSAGCSTGEEPYSIAITLLEFTRGPSDWDAKILATDLDSNVLATATKGVYGLDRVKGVSGERLRQWFLKGNGRNGGAVKVAPVLQENIRFRQLNLMDPWPMRGPFDVIFCRNVVIYFDKPTQKALFERFAQMLAPEGYLFVGHSETLFKMTDRFQLIGKSIYRRVT